MNRTNINTELPGNQLAGIVSKAALNIATARKDQLDLIFTEALEIQSRIGNVAILIEAIFDKLDDMRCDTPEQHKAHNAVSCFANAAMDSAQAIRSSIEQIHSLSIGGAQ